MKQISAKNTLNLSIPERIVLVEEIWDTIVAEFNDDTELTDCEKELIDQRLDAYQRNPEKTTEWNEVYERIVESAEIKADIPALEESSLALEKSVLED